MLFHSRLSDQSADTSAYKAYYYKYSDCFIIDKSKKIITVLRRITAVKKILSVGIGSYDNRKIICTDPQTEYSVAQNGLFKALVSA